jgi:hypothetical protein
MLFRLLHALASFQDMINHILNDLLGKRVMVYIDDIQIYRKHEKNYDISIKELRHLLARNDLLISPEKYIKRAKDVEFLIYILSYQRMRMDKDKAKAIKE